MENNGLSHVDFMNYGSFVSDNIFSYLGDISFNSTSATKIPDYVTTINKMKDDINNQFIASLNDYMDSLINYLLNPSSTVYFNTYNTNKAIAENILNKLTNLSNSIVSYISELSSQTSNRKNQITDEEKYYQKLLNKINNISSSNNSSSILKNESVELYKSQYIDNSILIFGIILLFIVFHTMYK
jgi:hypothetical protein